MESTVKILTKSILQRMLLIAKKVTTEQPLSRAMCKQQLKICYD